MRNAGIPDRETPERNAALSWLTENSLLVVFVKFVNFDGILRHFLQAIVGEH